MSQLRNSDDVTKFLEYIKLDTCAKFHDNRSNNNKLTVQKAHVK